jgi:hypothetical protein
MEFFIDNMQKTQAVTSEIIQKITLPGIRSASGIEVLEGRLFIAGDDSAWLYELDNKWQLVRKIPLFDSPNSGGEGIPKPLKPDLEAITSFPWKGEMLLLVIGSGSKKNRQDAFLVHPQTAEVRQFALTGLYDGLRALEGVVGGRRLNVEGLAVAGQELVFLQRGNVSGTNAVVSYLLDDFASWLEGNGPLPLPRVRVFTLPTAEGYPAGFSGAATLPSRPRLLLFTASVEATDDEILDGEMLGSFIGAIDLDSTGPETMVVSPITEHGIAYRGKVESISVLEETGEGCTALAVTDSDGGDSELLHLQIRW